MTKRTRDHARDVELLRVRMLERFGGVDPDARPARPPRGRLGRGMFTLDLGDEPTDGRALDRTGKEDGDAS